MPWLTRVFAAIQLAPSSGDLVARDFWGHTEGETWLDVRGKARDGTPQVARWYGVSQDPRSIKVISASTVDGAPACIMPQGPLCHSAPQLGPVKVTPDGPADELREYEQLWADADASSREATVRQLEINRLVARTEGLDQREMECVRRDHCELLTAERLRLELAASQAAQLQLREDAEQELRASREAQLRLKLELEEVRRELDNWQATGTASGVSNSLGRAAASGSDAADAPRQAAAVTAELAPGANAHIRAVAGDVPFDRGRPTVTRAEWKTEKTRRRLSRAVAVHRGVREGKRDGAALRPPPSRDVRGRCRLDELDHFDIYLGEPIVLRARTQSTVPLRAVAHTEPFAPAYVLEESAALQAQGLLLRR